MNLRDLKLPVTWLAILVAFINTAGFTTTMSVLYPLAKELGLSDLEASLLNAAYAICQFFAIPILGKLSDRFGRKPLLIACFSGSVIANLSIGFFSLPWVLFTARIVDGLTGGNLSVARLIISDTTPPARRPKAFSFFEAGSRLGFIAGPALSYAALSLSKIREIFSFRIGFLVAAAIAFLATLLCIFLLPETLPQKQSFRLKWNELGLSKIVKSAVHTNFSKLFVISFASGLTYTIFTFAFQPFLIYVLEQDAQMLAVPFVLIGILGAIAQIVLLAPLTLRFNLSNILSICLAIRGVLFLLIPIFPFPSIFFTIFIACSIVNSFPRPLLMSIVSLKSSSEEQGEILGINTSYLSLGNTIGPAIAGVLVSFSYGIPFWVASVLTLVTAWMAFNLENK
ncbi:MAG: MFS transporter [Pleurocapsa sp. MO_226.B13]|nr:MFS transporter [Pleurocapsa sp. MO_226.B13]